MTFHITLTDSQTSSGAGETNVEAATVADAMAAARVFAAAGNYDNGAMRLVLRVREPSDDGYGEILAEETGTFGGSQ